MRETAQGVQPPAKNFVVLINDHDYSLSDFISTEWTITDLTALSQNGVILASAQHTNSPDPSIVLLLPTELMVDSNRDGEMSFETASVHDKDATTMAKPFTFWLNDDHDEAHTVDEQDWEQDDLPVDSQHPADNSDDAIQWRRDLEDFTRLWITFKGITELVKHTDITLKLKFEPYDGISWKAEDGDPKITLFKAVEADGGRRYLDDEAVAYTQLDSHEGPGGAQRDFSHELGVVTKSISCELPPDFVANLSEAQPNKFLLFEGLGSGKGRLVLTIYKGTQKIGEYPPLYMELKDVKDMYERWTVGDVENAGLQMSAWPADGASPCTENRAKQWSRSRMKPKITSFSFTAGTCRSSTKTISATPPSSGCGTRDIGVALGHTGGRRFSSKMATEVCGDPAQLTLLALATFPIHGISMPASTVLGLPRSACSICSISSTASKTESSMGRYG